MSKIIDYGAMPPLIGDGMRTNKNGERNKQDWNTTDYIVHKIPLTAEPLTLAKGNIETSMCNLDTAATALDKLEMKHAAWFVRRALWKLEQALEVVGAK